MIDLYHRKNEIAIDLSSINNARAINIIYSGNIHGESMLPDGWHFFANKRKIVCLSFSAISHTPEILFNYTGHLDIAGAFVVDSQLKKHNCNIVIEDIDYWETSTGKFSENTQYWEGLGSTHEVRADIISTIIVNNGLIASQGEFFYKDGNPYDGDYHQYQDSQAMTGASYSDESEFIYRKNENGVLYNPREKLSEKQKLKLLNTKIASIPLTRGLVKKVLSKDKPTLKPGKGLGKIKIKGY